MNDKQDYLTGTVGFWLPLVQSLATGVIMAVVAYAISSLIDIEREWHVALLVGSTSAGLVWLASLGLWRRVVFRPEQMDYAPLEYLTQIPAIETEDIEPETVRIELVENEGRTVKFIDLPITQEQLARLAVGLLNGRPMSEASWTGGGNLFSRSEFARLRDTMLERGMLVWNSPNAKARGVSLTHAGMACMRYFATLGEGQ